MDTQQWFHNRGFRATGVVRNAYEHNDDDAYRFVYDAKKTRDSDDSPSMFEVQEGL